MHRELERLAAPTGLPPFPPRLVIRWTAPKLLLERALALEAWLSAVFAQQALLRSPPVQRLRRTCGVAAAADMVTGAGATASTATTPVALSPNSRVTNGTAPPPHYSLDPLAPDLADLISMPCNVFAAEAMLTDPEIERLVEMIREGEQTVEACLLSLEPRRRVRAPCRPRYL